MLASQTVVIATGSGATSIRSASASMTGVSRTAVVSRLRTTVVAVANATRRTKRYAAVAAGGDRHAGGDDVEDLGPGGQLGEHDHGGEEDQDRRDPAERRLRVRTGQDAERHEQQTRAEQGGREPVERRAAAVRPAPRSSSPTPVALGA